jgi:carbonic anhydrase/acetyltransferase-like protein (isoleucine patch superfamily)
MDKDLERSLARVLDALSPVARSPLAAPKPDGSPSKLSASLGTFAVLLIVLGVALHHHGMLSLGLVLAAAGGGLFIAGNLKLGAGKPGVRMGASVGQGTELDPTASIEMGASVGERAKLGPRSVVRMGANVDDGAVLEAGAIVSWGANVGEGAVIGEGAVVGAGSDVGAGARVPAGFVLHPGSSFGARESAQAVKVIKAPEPAQVADPRAARVSAVCTKLTNELQRSPSGVREFLGGSGQTIDGLQKTCTELLRRESELRREADLGQLPQERAAIAVRIDREQDAQVRDSLRGALAAIDGQQQERELLRVAADRLDAEHTRLLYTLEQLAAQFARLRSAGDGAARAPAELQEGVVQLRSELEAIADALESVAVAPPDEEMAAQNPGGRSRTR